MATRDALRILESCLKFLRIAIKEGDPQKELMVRIDEMEELIARTRVKKVR